MRNLKTITGTDKILSKCDCIFGHFVNGVGERILFTLALDKPPVHKINKEPRTRLFKRVKKSVLSHKFIYIENEDHKLVDLNGFTISFTCQLVKR